MIEVDHEDVVLRTFILFVQTARAVLKYADSHLYNKIRLSTIKLIVLRILASTDQAMRPSEIAEWTQTERHNITSLINRMKQEGLVTTERNTNNKRLVNITVTDYGREVLSQAMPAAREIVDHVMSSITEDDAILLEKLLKVLRQDVHDHLEHRAKFSQLQVG